MSESLKNHSPPNDRWRIPARSRFAAGTEQKASWKTAFPDESSFTAINREVYPLRPAAESLRSIPDHLRVRIRDEIEPATMRLRDVAFGSCFDSAP
jgi:hypothetical protein